MAPVEVAITSDGTAQLWNSCVWDVKTGTSLATFKGGGISAAKSLSLIGDSYLISAQKEKPLLQLWSLNGKDQQHMRIVCPGKVSSLAITPDGVFCAAAIEEKFHLWSVSDGALLAVVARHFQPISCMKFSDDGAHLISAGDDGLVLVWSLASLLNESNSLLNSTNVEPEHVWSDHVLRVSDLCIGAGGSYARVVTVSSDMTCKVYELVSGQLLASFVLDVAATAVATDPADYHIFAGGVDGRIYQIAMTEAMSSQNVHFDDEEKTSMAFIGHSKQVTALSVSFDGMCLLSASYDAAARLWHIPSKQCLRLFQHKGPVLNAFLTIAPDTLLSSTPSKLKRHVVNTSFQRSLENKTGGQISSNIFSASISITEKDDIFNKQLQEVASTVSGQSKDDLLAEHEQLKEVNHQLYNYSIQSVFSSLDG